MSKIQDLQGLSMLSFDAQLSNICENYCKQEKP